MELRINRVRINRARPVYILTVVILTEAPTRIVHECQGHFKVIHPEKMTSLTEGFPDFAPVI